MKQLCVNLNLKYEQFLVLTGVKGLVMGYRLLDLYVTDSEAVHGTRCQCLLLEICSAVSTVLLV